MSYTETTRPDLDALIEAGRRDVADADRCEALGISPASHQLHRRLREVTAALAAERARADQVTQALATSDKQHHECIDKLHALRAELEDSKRDTAINEMRKLADHMRRFTYPTRGHAGDFVDAYAELYRTGSTDFLRAWLAAPTAAK